MNKTAPDRPPAEKSGFAQIIALIVAVIILAVAVFLLINRHHSATKPAPKTTDLGSYCVGQIFDAGATGHCVSDIQTLVNYMEHSGLTECPFTAGATLAVSGNYDSATATQVKSVQQWSGCYAHQEGFTSNVPQTGKVDKATWAELCTYGYTDPSRTSAAGAAASLAAGRDAGCAQLSS